MLGDNIRELRKQKGYSQETFAQKLHVVRQTVSKWESGTSVPDASMLIKIAEELEVSVSELLGAHIANETDTDTIAERLMSINEQLVIRNRRIHKIWKTIIVVVLALVIAAFILMILNIATPRQVITSEPNSTSNASMPADRKSKTFQSDEWLKEEAWPHACEIAKRNDYEIDQNDVSILHYADSIDEVDVAYPVTSDSRYHIVIYFCYDSSTGEWEPSSANAVQVVERR